jgi:hypothetical protein
MLDLQAAVFAVYAPLAQVLAVVAKEPISVFAKPGACPSHDFRTLEATSPRGSYPYGVSVSEARERNLFHRSPPPVLGKCGIVHDHAAAHVDTMMLVGETRRDEVCTQRWLVLRREQSIRSYPPQNASLGSREIMTAQLPARASSPLHCESALSDEHGSPLPISLQHASATRPSGTLRLRLPSTRPCVCS